MDNYISTFLKGLWIGGTLTVPGVSGGSMAMILGIYEQLIDSINKLFHRDEKKKKSLLFLAVFTLGGLAGVVALSGVVAWLLKCFPAAMIFFFSGAVAGGIPAIFFEMRREIFKWYHALYFVGGILLVVFLSMMPPGVFRIKSSFDINSMLMQFFGGLIAAAALVLPGISVSHMLYVLGIYESLIDAIASFDFLLILPFAIGGVIGIVLMARAVSCLFQRWKTQTYLAILGFVIGSVFELISGVSLHEISLFHLLIFFMGFFGIYLLFKKSNAGT
ncbi:MAG: DUF368 domain-containing protein [Clostridia bacterium]|nr:DUF368 domain-containing protein [Clostridia bacterium]